MSSKISLRLNVSNINWLIHSQKVTPGKDDLELFQGILQIVIRKLLTSTNTFVLTNTDVKKDIGDLSSIRTISDLIVLSFDKAKMVYNDHGSGLTKADKRNNPIANWVSRPSIVIWFEEKLMTTNGFFYQRLMNHFTDVKGFSATVHEFFRKSFYNQIPSRR